jgi:hypothetical protein
MTNLPIMHVGVDPGETGAIAYRIGDDVVSVVNMPSNDAELVALFRDLSTKGRLRVLVEEVGLHMRGNNAASAAVLAASARACAVAALSHGASVMRTGPRVWQAAFLGKLTLPGSPKEPERGAPEESVREWRREKAKRRDALKNAVKARAQCLFRDARVTKETADAVALLWFCERYHQDNPGARELPKAVGVGGRKSATPKRPGKTKQKPPDPGPPDLGAL